MKFEVSVAECLALPYLDVYKRLATANSQISRQSSSLRLTKQCSNVARVANVHSPMYAAIGNPKTRPMSNKSEHSSLYEKAESLTS